MAAMTTAEPTTVCIKTRAGTAAATAMVVTMGPLAAAGMTMASGPAVQGAILTIECRSVTRPPGTVRPTIPVPACSPSLAAAIEMPV